MNAFKTLLLALTIFLGLYAEAYAQVPAARRALIIINELDSTGIPELSPLYSNLENLTVGLPTLPIVRNNYAVIRVLRNNAANLAAFRSTARTLAANPGIDAIDVILALHGRDGRLKWADGTVNMADMTAFMNQATTQAELNLRAVVQRKLRIVYNTSCFGASHRAALRAIGFDAAVGSIGVNANAEAEYPAFLAAWNLGASFLNSFAATNSSAALAATDGPLVATGNLLNNFLKNVNSRKLFSGNLAITINSNPQ